MSWLLLRGDAVARCSRKRESGPRRTILAAPCCSPRQDAADAGGALHRVTAPPSC
jgi:hypothetical protein